MKIFKFGGASVQDADGVKNLAKILLAYKSEKLIIVVSAMAKTTNKLEALAKAYFLKQENIKALYEDIRHFHYQIISDLFENKKDEIFTIINNQFVEIDWILEEEPGSDYNFIYDQIVSVGEMLSSKIVQHYLAKSAFDCQWLDARDCIKTDNLYREANIDWSETEKQTKEICSTLFKRRDILVTQGFIGCTSENYSTTLGREGSDFSAAIFAYCLQAESVSIWKDVDGVLNADPKWFAKTTRLDSLSYTDALELTYYGATVIHPKTIQPLQKRNIPLVVRSFLNSKSVGTIISQNSITSPLIPCFIFKINQVLITLYTKDFGFMGEQFLGEIFKTFAHCKVKINLLQHTASTLSICVDEDEIKIKNIISALQKDFQIKYNENVELVTIRYYDEATIQRVCKEKIILMEQRSRQTAQIVMQNKA